MIVILKCVRVCVCAFVRKFMGSGGNFIIFCNDDVGITFIMTTTTIIMMMMWVFIVVSLFLFVLRY